MERVDAVSVLGRLLREWRQGRNLSQLALAEKGGISARHLSFVETGRAQPGRDVVLRLASALDLPLRERNAALMAAGYAPLYGHSRLEDPEMAPVARAIDFMLRQHEPFPAMVIGRLGTVLRVNGGARAFLDHFVGERHPGSEALNIYRLVLSRGGFRPHIVNWPEVARFVILRLRGEISATPGDSEARAFLNEMLAQPGLPAECHSLSPGSSAPPVVPTEFRAGGRVLSLFHTITTVGTPQDVMLQELRVECSYPVDAQTESLLRAMAEAREAVHS